MPITATEAQTISALAVGERAWVETTAEQFTKGKTFAGWEFPSINFEARLWKVEEVERPTQRRYLACVTRTK